MTSGGSTKVWWPALDALRGVAVAAVLLYHHDPGLLPGGYLGVSFFFTLSGFLITTIVLREHAASGRVSFRRFWARRARRLAPIALAGLVLALGVATVVTDPARRPAVSGDAVAAALDVANWRFASGAVTYGDTLAPPSPVSHYWSPAIEEQFYLVFPVVAAVALRHRRRVLAAVLAATAAGSIALQLAFHDVNRIYLGTDTRAAELAIGGLAALWWARAATRPVRRVASDVAPVAALALLGAAWRTTPLDSAFLWRGGVPLHALLAGVVVLGAVGGGIVGRLGSARPLVALGRISYGVYVVHFPLFLLLTPARLHAGSAATLAVRLVATLALAALLHVLVEQPVRVGGALPGRQAGLAFATAVAAVVVLAAGAAQVDRDGAAGLVADGATEVRTQPTDAAGLPVGVVADPPGAAPATTTTIAPPPSTSVAPAVAPPGTGPGVAPSPAPATTATSAPAPPPAPPPPATHVPHFVVVGDSTAAATGLGMQQWAAASRSAVVDVVSAPSCTLLHEGEYRIRPGWTRSTEGGCRDLTRRAVEQANAVHADAIILFIGSVQLSDWRLVGDVTDTHVGQAVWDTRYRAAAAQRLVELGTAGIPILWADLPTPAWVPVGPGGGPPPGTGAPFMNDAGRAAALNRIDDELAATVPLVQRWDYVRNLAGPDGTIPRSLRPDGLHLDWNQVGGLLDAGMAGQLRQAFDAVVVANGLVGGSLQWPAGT